MVILKTCIQMILKKYLDLDVSVSDVSYNKLVIT